MDVPQKDAARLAPYRERAAVRTELGSGNASLAGIEDRRDVVGPLGCLEQALTRLERRLDAVRRDRVDHTEVEPVVQLLQRLGGEQPGFGHLTLVDRTVPLQESEQCEAGCDQNTYRERDDDQSLSSSRGRTT
ncbi:MAG: hypothetical protein E6G67_10885, partial [Actinobacteria bacterium]